MKMAARMERATVMTPNSRKTAGQLGLHLADDELTPLPSDKTSPAVQKPHTVADNVRETRDDHGGEVEDGHSRVGLVSGVPGRDEVHASGKETTYR